MIERRKRTDDGAQTDFLRRRSRRVAHRRAAAPRKVAPDEVKIDDNKVAQSLTGTAGRSGGRRQGLQGSPARQLPCLPCQQGHVEGAVPRRCRPAARRRRRIAGSRRAARHRRQFQGRVRRPDTVMPGFYSLEVGMNVRKDLVGKTILTAAAGRGCRRLSGDAEVNRRSTGEQQMKLTQTPGAWPVGRCARRHSRSPG